MNDVVDAILPTLRANMAAIGGNPVPQVYFGGVPSTAQMPYGWIYTADDVAAEPYFGMMSTLVVLHLYARSAREIQLLENACVFLDDYRAPGFGNAYAPHFTVQSKPRLPEDEGRWHTTISLLATYADKRKMGVG